MLTNGDGKKLGRDGDKIVNEIPGAEVFEVDGLHRRRRRRCEPIYTVPADDDYQVAIVGRDKHRKAEGEEQDHGGRRHRQRLGGRRPDGEAQADREGHAVSSRATAASSTRPRGEGEFPTIRLAANGPNGGMHAHLSHMQASANDEIALKLDHAAGQIVVAGGGKKASSFDLKVTHVQPEGEDKVVEQKAIKYDPAKVHTIQSSPTAAPGADAVQDRHEARAASTPGERFARRFRTPSAGPAPSAPPDAIGESSAPHRGTGSSGRAAEKALRRDATSRARERRLPSPRHVVQVGREREVPQEDVEDDRPRGRLHADHLLGLRDLLRDEDPHPVVCCRGGRTSATTRTPGCASPT